MLSSREGVHRFVLDNARAAGQPFRQTSCYPADDTYVWIAGGSQGNRAWLEELNEEKAMDNRDGDVGVDEGWRITAGGRTGN